MLSLSCTHIRHANENILDHVYSASGLIAHMSVEMDANSLLVLSAAPLLRDWWCRRGGGERDSSMHEEEEEKVQVWRE